MKRTTNLTVEDLQRRQARENLAKEAKRARVADAAQFTTQANPIQDQPKDKTKKTKKAPEKGYFSHIRSVPV